MSVIYSERFLTFSDIFPCVATKFLRDLVNMSQDNVVEKGREGSSSMAEELTGQVRMDQREFRSMRPKRSATTVATNPNLSKM